MHKVKNIWIQDTAFDPELEGDQVHVQGYGSDKPMYKVWISLAGRDVPFVDTVTYRLHPTFSNPNKKVKRSLSNPNCTLIIWTWGIFNVRAKVNFTDGTTLSLNQTLTYGDQLNSKSWKWANIKEE